MVTEAPVPLRIVFFGTPAFAVPTLERLLASAHPVAAVVTQPDRPKGRGHHATAPPVKQVALAHRIPVLQPSTIRSNTFLTGFSSMRPDLGVVAAFGRILDDATLQVPRLGFVNVHASLLPRYRGAAPVQRAVMAGETMTGVTIMRMVRELDAGPILAASHHPIPGDATSDVVEAGLALIGADLLAAVVNRLAAGPVVEIPQDDRMASYAPRLTTADAPLDWSLPAASIHNRVRGLHPWPHAHTFLRGCRVLILKTTVDEAASRPDLPPGTIAAAAGDGLLVAAGDGRLVRILEIQPEGRRRMSVRDFLAGHPVAAGARVGPQS